MNTGSTIVTVARMVCGFAICFIIAALGIRQFELMNGAREYVGNGR